MDLSDFPNAELVRCNGCARELQMWERFCPHCGVDQFAKIYSGKVDAEKPTSSTPLPDDMPPPLYAAPSVAAVVATPSADTPSADAHSSDAPSPHMLNAGTAPAPLASAVGMPVPTSRWPNIVLGVLLGVVLALATHIALERRYFSDGPDGGLAAFRSDLSLLGSAATGQAPAMSVDPAPAPAAAVAPPAAAPLSSGAPTSPAAKLADPGPADAPPACNDTLKALGLCRAP